MIQPILGMKLLPIEAAIFSNSIIIGVMSEGPYRRFLINQAAQGPLYRQVMERMYGTLHFHGLSLPEFEKEKGELPKFAQEHPHAALTANLPFFEFMTVFADKPNYNLILIKILKSSHIKASPDELWKIYLSFKRQIRFSIYHEYVSYYVERSEFDAILDSSSAWSIEESQIPYEYREHLSDNALIEILNRALVNDIRYNGIGAAAQSYHRLHDFFPDKFEYGMAWDKWYATLKRIFPILCKYTLEYPQFWSLSATKFGKILNDSGDLKPLVREIILLETKTMEYQTGIPNIDYVHEDVATSKLFLYLDAPIEKFRLWARENPMMFLNILVTTYDMNPWAWDVSKI